jgi:hypothetical protein
VLVETLVVYFMKVRHFAKALLHTTLVNIASVLFIVLAWPIVNSLDIDEDKLFPMLPILFFASIIIEGLLLKTLNKQQSGKRLFIASLLMNTASFGMLYLLFLVLVN